MKQVTRGIVEVAMSYGRSSIRWWRVRVFDLEIWEIGIVAGVCTILVVLNKAVIRDQGNTWPGLIALSIVAGLLVVGLIRLVMYFSRRV